MILINLLPKEQRVREVKRIHIPILPIALVLFFIFVVSAFYQLVIFSRIGIQRRKLDVEWNQLKPQNSEAEQLQRELGASVAAEVHFFNQFIDPQLEMARVLNSVSDRIPNSITLASFKCERKQDHFRLILSGISEAASQDSSLVEIQNFVTNLKEQFAAALASQPASKKDEQAPVKVPINASITTTTKSEGLGRGLVTQFTATIQTEGLG